MMEGLTKQEFRAALGGLSKGGVFAHGRGRVVVA